VLRGWRVQNSNAIDPRAKGGIQVADARLVASVRPMGRRQGRISSHRLVPLNFKFR